MTGLAVGVLLVGCLGGWGIWGRWGIDILDWLVGITDQWQVGAFSAPIDPSERSLHVILRDPPLRAVGPDGFECEACPLGQLAISDCCKPLFAACFLGHSTIFPIRGIFLALGY